MLAYKKEYSYIVVDECIKIPNRYKFLVGLFIKKSDIELANKIFNIIKDIDKSFLSVGYRIVDGWSEIYLYVEISKGIQKSIKEALKDLDEYFEVSISKDKNHSFYINELLPNELEYIYIKSKQITNELENEGIDLKNLFEVEHYADFEIKSQADRFLENIKEEGFEFKDYIDEEGLNHAVAVVKKHSLDDGSIKKEIDVLYKYISKEHGKYYLWSVVV